MKKYLISGFNTVQDVKLEAGTYTLVAYVKSMYGNVYTFALGDGTDWDEFSIDVIQGQLCKVWLSFTIDKKVTKFKPIANNFSESLPVYVTDLQLTRGNIPVEAGASPFDIDKILDDLHDEIDGIEDFTNEAFADGLLNREEKTQLRASLDAIGSIVESVKGSYDKLLDNPFIHENTMDSITARYYAFIASWISDGDPRGLKPVILWIVNGDNIISQNERDEKDRALNAFNDALYAYNQAEKEVYNDVGENSIAPKIINGFWAFWDSELQKFVKSEFSAIGDDGHSPYVNEITGTWWEWSPELGKYKDTSIKAEGEDAVLYTLVPSVSQVKKDKNGVPTVATVSCSILKTVGGISTLNPELPDGYTFERKVDRGTSFNYPAGGLLSVNGIDDEVEFSIYDNNASPVGLVARTTIAIVDDGQDGYTPIKGTDYFDGKDGQDGTSRYLWIRYSQDSNGNPFVTDPTNAKYIGIATTLTNNPPSSYLSYDWSLIKGTDGIAGEKGSDGQTSYLHIKYSNDGTTFTANNGETVGAWIGTYVDFVEADSMVFNRYTWNKVKGEDGKDGKDGTDGVDGKDGKDGIDGEPPKISDGYPKTQYAIGDSKTIYPTIGWGENTIEVTESKPYLWSRQEIKYDNGDTLYTGYLMLTNITPVPYMAGEWDMRVAYTRNDKSYPIATYKRGTNNRPLYYYPKKEGVIEYVRFVKPDVNNSSTWYKQNDLVWYENDGSNGDPVCPLGIYKSKYNNNRYLPTTSSWWDNVTADYAPNGVEGQKLWEFADGMELIITEAIMANFAKLDSFVFHKGKMFSQEGTLNGVAGSLEYTDEDHEPNFEVDGISGKVKMKDADIEGTITGSVFTSNNGKVVVDGRSNQIYLKDEDSDAVRTILSPRKLPLTPSSYFGSSSTTNVSLGTLQKTYSKNSSSVNLITIPAGDSSAYQITIPSITMSVNVDHPGDLGGQDSFSNLAEMRLEIYKGGILQYLVGSVSAMSVGGLDGDTRITPLSSYTIQGSGVWSVRVTHVHTIHTPPSNSTGTVMNINGNAIVAKVVNSSAIGSNGMIIATSGTEYTYMVGGTYEVRRGNVGFRITSAGVQKSSNMNLSNPTWNPI